MEDRWREIRLIHHENRYFYLVGGGLILVSIGIWIGALLFADDGGYFTNLYTEMISIAVTVFVLNLLARWREEARHRTDLLFRMGSRVNAEAVRAVEELRRNRWLFEGWANGARLGRANLQTANLSNASLKNAKLTYANLRQTYAPEANLSGAILDHADLRDADLTGANLELADVAYADLRGANLRGASLVGARLLNVQMSQSTILPDGVPWSPDRDLSPYMTTT